MVTTTIAATALSAGSAVAVAALTAVVSVACVEVSLAAALVALFHGFLSQLSRSS